jgi:hypothetical protein
MRSRTGRLSHRTRTRSRSVLGRAYKRLRRNERAEIIERLDRLLYLVENESRAVDEALSAILERLRMLEAQRSAGETAGEASTTKR